MGFSRARSSPVCRSLRRKKNKGVSEGGCSYEYPGDALVEQNRIVGVQGIFANPRLHTLRLFPALFGCRRLNHLVAL